MNGNEWDRIQAIFEELSEVDAGARAALLAERCGGDESLRRTVEGMLHSAALEDDFLTSPFELMPGGSAARTIGGFAVLEEIGRGGMGVVYRARQKSLDREVALKILPHSWCQSESQLDRFEVEARSAGRLHHPGIVTVFAHGKDEEVHYFAMELVEGPNLAEVIAARRTGAAQGRTASAMDLLERPASIARLIAEVADALHVAHEAGVYHRDVKPSNLFVTGDGHLKLGDFGVVLDRASGAHSSTGEIVGSPHYLSPEQAIGDVDAVGAQTDVYGLGVVLYELLAGQRPFAGDGVLEVIQSVKAGIFRPVRSVNPRAPRDLSMICEVAMSRDRANRYATAAEMGADLRRALALEPILARPLPRRVRAARWARRHRGPILTAGLTVLLTVTTVRALSNARLRREIEADLVRLEQLAAETDDSEASLLPWSQAHQVIGRLEERADLAHSGHAARLASARDALEAKSFAVLGRGLENIHAAKEPTSALLPWETDDSLLFQGVSQVQVRGVFKGEGGMGEEEFLALTGITWTVQGVPSGGLPTVATLRPIDPVAGQPHGGSQSLANPMSFRTRRGFYRLTLRPPGLPPLEFDRLVVADAPDPLIRVPSDLGADPWQDMVLITPEPAFYDLGPTSDLPIGGREFLLEPFWLDQYEVSNTEYAEFLALHPGPTPPLWIGDSFPEGMGDRPVTGVAPEQAQRYAAWKGKRLATLAEIVYAACGPNGRPFPWPTEPGDTRYRGGTLASNPPTESVAALREYYCKVARPVRSDPDAATPLGVHHLLGNATELTGSLAVETKRGVPVRTMADYRYLIGGRFNAASRGQRMLTSVGMVRFSSDRYPFVGFRCARTHYP